MISRYVMSVEEQLQKIETQCREYLATCHVPTLSRQIGVSRETLYALKHGSPISARMMKKLAKQIDKICCP